MCRDPKSGLTNFNHSQKVDPVSPGAGDPWKKRILSLELTCSMKTKTAVAITCYILLLTVGTSSGECSKKEPNGVAQPEGDLCTVERLSNRISCHPLQSYHLQPAPAAATCRQNLRPVVGRHLGKKGREATGMVRSGCRPLPRLVRC